MQTLFFLAVFFIPSHCVKGVPSFTSHHFVNGMSYNQIIDCKCTNGGEDKSDK